MMWRILLYFVPLLGPTVADMSPDTTKFNIHIREDAARFSQHIETDLYKNHVYFHTPAHNDIQETYKMQDFNKNIEIFCMPSKRQCFLTRINTKAYPDAGKLMESITHMWNNGIDSISDNEVTTIHLNYTVTGLIADMTFLGQEMRTFVEKMNFPLYRLKQISPADILPYHSSESPQTARRQALIGSNPQPCRDDKPVKLRYGYVGSSGCDWLFFCDSQRAVSTGVHHELVTSCPRQHVRDNIFYTCLCCPEAHSLSTCYHCEKVTE